jgi:putative endonuclease
MFYVYVLHSLEDHGLYFGFSTNLKKRIAEHEDGASFATKYRGPWKLIYYEACIDRHDAVEFPCRSSRNEVPRLSQMSSGFFGAETSRQVCRRAFVIHSGNRNLSLADYFGHRCCDSLDQELLRARKDRSS